MEQRNMPDETVYDVEPGRFDEQVIEESKKQPVVVDFWAEWCAPCRTLGPMLEKVVGTYAGRARLAKVNIEQDPNIAVRYGVQGIPAVKVFRDGEVVGEFVGAIPEPDVQRLLSRLLPSASDEVVAEGDRFLAERKLEDAEESYRRALEGDPGHTGALLRLGTLALELGRHEEAQEVLGRIEEDAKEYDTARAMLSRIEFSKVCHENGGPDACQARAAESPDDLDARYALACCMAAAGQYERALEEFLGIVSNDKDYREGAAREAMVHIFNLVGPRSELANSYRKKLASVLY
jgi:putative thioredoxin